MTKYFIKYGLGPTMENYDVIEADNFEEALDDAYQLSVVEYSSYEGMHGIPSYSDISDEIIQGEEPTKQEIEEIDERYNEEVENWIDYSAELYIPEKHDGYLH
jgi:hypothetical protein